MRSPLIGDGVTIASPDQSAVLSDAQSAIADLISSVPGTISYGSLIRITFDGVNYSAAWVVAFGLP